MISIILYKAQEPGNIGAIARAMKNFGFENLVLIEPECNHLEKEALDRSTKAKEILKKAKIRKKSSLKEFDYLGSFYSRFATVPLRLLFRSPVIDQANKLLIYTDRFPQQCHRQRTEKAIKRACRGELAKELPFHVYHHASSSNSWLQVADYCAYAVARKWEHNDLTYYNQFRNHLAKVEYDVLHADSTLFY